MPRKARIDAPGCLHHVIARGIDHQNLFKDKHDRENFVDRLDNIVTEVVSEKQFSFDEIIKSFSTILSNATTVALMRKTKIPIPAARLRQAQSSRSGDFKFKRHPVYHF